MNSWFDLRTADIITNTFGLLKWNNPAANDLLPSALCCSHSFSEPATLFSPQRWVSPPERTFGGLGFCVTGVGLPLLGIIAVGYSGCRDLREVASRVHPLYGLFYTVVCYMAIGPCFAIPRTGTVSFEIAVRPFLGADPSAFALPIFLAFFLGISCWLAASPSKLVDRIGKFLTPALLVTLAVMIVMSFATPMGDFQAPGKAYDEPIKAAFQGVLDGYNTLDAIAALVFATLIVNSVKEIGFTDPKAISSQVMKSGMLAGLLLALVYIFIAKIGAESVAAIGMQDTGAPVLAESAKVFFGSFGAYLLAAIVLLACITTAVGLLTCCAKSPMCSGSSVSR